MVLNLGLSELEFLEICSGVGLDGWIILVHLGGTFWDLIGLVP